MSRYAFNVTFCKEVDLSQTQLISIDYQCFKDAVLLEKISLPSTLYSIESYAFYNCVSLKSILIPKNVRYLNIGAFEECYSLSEIKFEEDCKLHTIESYALYGCTFLKEITLPKSLKYIGKGNFSWCGIKRIYFESKNPWDFALWASEGGWEPTDDGQKNCDIMISSLSLGEMVIKGTYSQELRLTYVTDGVDKCVITEIHTDENNKTIDIPAVITDENGSYKVVGIETHSWFINNPVPQQSIEQINFKTENGENYIEEIRSYAFQSCWNLKKVNFSNLTNLKFIDSYAFYCTFGMTSPEESDYIDIDLSNTKLEYMGDFAFYWRDSESNPISLIKSIVLPSTLTTIGSGAFQNCNSLETLDFSACSELENFEYSYTDMTEADYYFESLTKGTLVNKIDLSKCNKITYLPSYAFNNNNTIESGVGPLASVTLPKSLKFIGSSAFAQNYSLTSIEIPENVLYIGNSVFADCSSLASVTFADKSNTWTLDNTTISEITTWDPSVKTAAQNAEQFTKNSSGLNSIWIKNIE